MSNPDQIERDVAQTRTSLSNDVARLNDRVSPSKFVGRRTDKIKDSAASIKNRLMGSSDSAGEAAADKMNSALSKVSDASDGMAAKVGDAAGGAPQALRQQTQGNPIAAGLIAFGVGWLLSSLVPATQVEQAAAKQVEDNAGGLIDPLKESAQEVAGNLQQPLQDSAEQLKQTATNAADKTTEHAKSAAADVKDNAKEQQQR
jgi:hypothetical protein